MKIQLPFDKINKFPITQYFGEKFIYRGKMVSHKGVDWAMPKYTPLLAPFSGVVYRVEKQRDWGYGRTVYIKCQDEKLGRIEALLAHCEAIWVKEGYNITRGHQVALSGRTGFWRGVNGYHLHFGLKVNGIYVNPLEYLKIKNVDENQSSIFNDEANIKSYHGDYVVKKGDSLWKIAKSFYGNGAHYMEIFNVNQDLLKNPNKIYTGQVLRIPALKNKGI